MRCLIVATLSVSAMAPSISQGGEGLPATTPAASASVAPQPTPIRPVAPTAEASAEVILLQEKLAELDRLQAEVNALREATRTPAVIVVDVELLEASLTRMRELGIDFEQFKSGRVTSASFVEGAASGGIVQLAAIDGGHDLAGFIEALKQNNVAKTLAEPTLATVGGRPASLHVGGQFPMPKAPAATEAVAYQQWGTDLDVLAEALGNGRVRLQIRSRISELNDERAIEIDGQKVPSLRTKQCHTSCE